MDNMLTPRTQDMADMCAAIKSARTLWWGFDPGAPGGDFWTYSIVGLDSFSRDEAAFLKKFVASSGPYRAFMPLRQRALPVTASVHDLAHLDERRIDVKDICRVFRVPPHLLNEGA